MILIPKFTKRDTYHLYHESDRYRVHVRADLLPTTDFKEWVENTIKHPFSIWRDPGYSLVEFFFEDQQDAALFKLWWKQ